MPVPVEDYAWDAEGNRTASHLSALYSSNTHNQLLEDDSYTYAYDLKGNRVSRTEKATGNVETYSYDSQNRLVGCASPTTTASYAYDALDRRVGKMVGTVAEAFVYDPWDAYSSIANDVVLDFENGALTRRWLHGTSVDEPLAFERYAGTDLPGSGSEHTMLADRLGSVIEVVETSTNTLAASAEFDSFGARTVVGTPERYGFTGREHDDESGLIYYRARHYDPVSGQFIQRDPIGFAAGDLNLYAYTWNDPYNWTDPRGLATADCASGPACNPQGDKAVGAVGVGTLSLADKIRALLTLANIVNSVTGEGDDTAPDAPPVPNEETPDDNADCDPTDPTCEDEPEESADCKKAKRKIKNIHKQINDRMDAIAANHEGLPQYGPGPDASTVQGHWRIINRLWKRLSF